MTTESVDLVSSVLQGASYDDETGDLTLVFASGKTYVRPDTDKDTWESLKNAPSPGNYFNTVLKGR